MKKQSAGLLVYRKSSNRVEVLIAHPGGPFFARKDPGIWTIPKGLYDSHEDPLSAAKREYAEEIGFPAPDGEYVELGEIKRSDGKVIKSWAVEGELDTAAVKSNDFEMEWPPKSGQMQKFPEIDKAMWADLSTASSKLQAAQVEFLRRLAEYLGIDFEPPASDTPKQNSLF